MKLTKWAMAIATVLCSMNAFAIDDTPENRNQEALRYESSMDQKVLLNTILESMSTQVGKGNPLMPVIVQFIRDEVMTPDVMKTFSHNMLINNYSAGELKALADFYSSPEGRSVMQKMPIVMANSMRQLMPVLQQRMKAKEPLFKQRVSEFYAAHPELRSR